MCFGNEQPKQVGWLGQGHRRSGLGESGDEGGWVSCRR